MAEDISSSQPTQSAPEPAVTEHIQTLSSATPGQTVEIPGGPMATDTSKTMRNMLIAFFLTVLVIIGFLLYAKFTGKTLTKEPVATPTQAVMETVAPTDSSQTDEEAANIEIEEPDFTEIETDINAL